MAQSFFEAKIAVLVMMIMSTNSNMETDSDSHLLNSVLIAHRFMVICIPYAPAFCI